MSNKWCALRNVFFLAEIVAAQMRVGGLQNGLKEREKNIVKLNLQQCIGVHSQKRESMTC